MPAGACARQGAIPSDRRELNVAAGDGEQLLRDPRPDALGNRYAFGWLALHKAGGIIGLTLAARAIVR